MGIIFDLDGTLIDSMTVWEKADFELLKRYGFSPDREYREKIVRLNFSEGVEFILEKYDIKKSFNDIKQELWEIVYDEYDKNMDLKEGVFELISSLKQRNKKIALATSSIKEMCEACLKRNNIYDMFDAVVFSEEVGKNKTNPDVFLEAAKRICVNPKNCIVFEDAPHAVIGAKKAGMKVIGVYDEFFKANVSEMKSLCDRYIYSMSEIDPDNLK